MTRFLWRMVVVALLLGGAVAVASNTDSHIKNLKSENPDVRAKAAYELGCG